MNICATCHKNPASIGLKCAACIDAARAAFWANAAPGEHREPTPTFCRSCGDELRSNEQHGWCYRCSKQKFGEPVVPDEPVDEDEDFEGEAY